MKVYDLLTENPNKLTFDEAFELKTILTDEFLTMRAFAELVTKSPILITLDKVNRELNPNSTKQHRLIALLLMVHQVAMSQTKQVYT